MPRLMLLPLLLRCIAAFQPSTHTRQSLPLLPSLPNHAPLVSKASSHCLVSRSHPAPLQNRCRQPLMRTGDAPDAADRAIACAVYLLPFLDGFRYGLYIYKTVPIIGQLAFQFLPLIPFAGLGLFIALSVFSNNANLPRFVRFNIQQAILLDIALIIPGFVGSASRMFPPEINAMGSNFVFYVMVLTIGYSVFSNVQGKTPDQVPVLSQAAASQIGPF